MRPLTPPEARPRRYGFALTPLADAMFQLLLFFMLTSTLAPWSLLPLTGGGPAGRGPVEGAPAPAPPSGAGREVAVWHLERGRIRAGTEVLALDALPGVVSALAAAGVDEVLVFPARAATVQDVASVLEALAAGHIGAVRLVAGPGG